MTDLALVRIDNRLIHGQVCVMWTKKIQAKGIVVVDDIKSKDEMLKQIFQMVAPVGCVVKTISIDEAVEEFNSEKINEFAPVLVLFGDVKTAYDSYMKGFSYKTLQIGGIGLGPGKKKVFGPVSMSEDEAKQINEIESKGVKVYFQETPNHSVTEWDSVCKKVFPNI